MPLAIELAAARAAALSLEQIAARLGDSLELLRAGRRTALTRQQTLRATIDWSHDLLTGEERVLFRRLAVFAGGFTLEAAEEVCAGGAIARRRVVDLLARLVEKSLVVA
jgi:predicted ATPase